MNKALGSLLALALIFGPYSTFAQEEVPPVVEPAPVETLLVPAEPAVPVFEEEAVGEILATSTEVSDFLYSEPVPEEEAVEADTPELVPDTYIEGEVIVKLEGEEPVLVIVDETVEDAIAELSGDADVEYVVPNYVRSVEVLATSSDIYADRLWGLDNTGQKVNAATGTPDADTDAPEAWSISTGENVIVAVIDTGVDYTHPDLTANMWDGTNCVGLDGAGNTLAGGCIHGYDFADDDFDPMPVTASTSADHGTHVAGIIAAAKDNGHGIIGIAPNVKIMALRFGLDTYSEAQAIRFAIANGARIINASYSGPIADPTHELPAFQEFADAGGIIVAAAANGGTDGEGDDLDNLPVVATSTHQAAYPAQYDISSIISVAATGSTDDLAFFSNYGASSVDLGAPGVITYSTLPGDIYGFKSGTSMAAPHVAGTAALILSKYGSFTSAKIKEAILAGVDANTSLTGKSVTGGRLNAHGALLAAEALVPPPVIAPPSSGGGGGGGGGGSKKKKKESTPAPKSTKPIQRLPQTATSTGSVLGATSYTFTLDLSLGSTGSEVMELQKKLKTLGLFTAEPTGYFGPITASAVRAFQTSKSIIPNGAVDAATRAALNGTSVIASPSAPASIAELQVKLLALQTQLAALLAAAR